MCSLEMLQFFGYVWKFVQWGSVINNEGLHTTLKSVLNVFRCCYFESCENSDVVKQWNLIEGTKNLIFVIKKSLKIQIMGF